MPLPVLMVVALHIAAHGRPPSILQVFREPLKPGVEAEYDRIESDRRGSVQSGTREEADAAASGAGSRVFAVRPSWSHPAEDWIAADPEFWPRRR